ncbi:MAG: YebC/PmpR family DNA-binding transcriptional regulator [Clostridia bacterium]
MAGHSKFANRKHRKAKQDKKRAKLFTKISREITIAVKEGGDDPEFNPRLRLALDNAKTNNIPNDNIKRALERGLGKTGDADFEEFIYEGYGPGGVAILLEMASDNRMRAAADVRHILTKHGGSLGQDGCVAWMFNRKGVITVKKSDKYSYDDLILIVLEAGAEDIEVEDEAYLILTDYTNLYSLKDSLEDVGLNIEESSIEFIAENTLNIPKEYEAEIEELLDDLEDCEDVQNIYTNLD